MARIELSAEVKAIEGLIESGQQVEASSLLKAVQPQIGRAPQYRYLVCLYDSKFRLRSEQDLVRDVTELVGEQPDLMEATALLAELYARNGDAERADLFARLALESPSPSARARALEVLQARAQANDRNPSSSVRPIDAFGGPTAEMRNAPARPSNPAKPADSLRGWFDEVRRGRVHRRTPSYGMRAAESVAEMLLTWGKAVAEGQTYLSPEPLTLSRDSLEVVDRAIVAMRKQRGVRASAKSDTSRTMAAAGFFAAVALHELDATVVEVAADDGGCKVVLPSGAGTRPLLVTAAFVEGTGPSLTQTLDRLLNAQVLASMPPSTDARYRPHSSNPGSTVSQRSLTPSSAATSVETREELALTRPEVETTPIRALEAPPLPSSPPPLDLAAIVRALASSVVGQDIAARSGSSLMPSPHGVEALESYCLATRGEQGAAPEKSVWIPPDQDEEIIVAWGAFVGESLIAAYGGVWERDPNAPSDPRLFRVVCQEKVAAWPITQLYLRLKNGPQHNLMEYMAAVGRLLG